MSNKGRKQPSLEVQKEFVNKSDLRLAMELKLNAKDDIPWKCAKCGKVYVQKYGTHTRLFTGEKRHGCPECGKEQRRLTRKLTTIQRRAIPSEEVQKEFADKEDLDKAMNKQLSSTTMVEWVCPRCGLHYRQLLHNHMNCSTGEKRHGCPKCWLEIKREKAYEKSLS